ncbi:MAG: ADP-heptose--LPS heptosyltransferase [Chloroflexi bacterium]|nr:ADP-heptose--LPS heptosyltransferase [Chloroflexota bacterium]
MDGWSRLRADRRFDAEQDPDLLAGWVAAMRRGDFDAAWKIGDLVRAAAGPVMAPPLRPRHEQAIWSGRPLTGRQVLVRCYHGLGDTIQFARFLPRLAAEARHLVVWAQPELIPLLRDSALGGDLLPLHDGDPGVPYDVDLEIMEIPFALRLTLDDVRVPVPYLRVPARGRGDHSFSIGVVTTAGAWNAGRSIPPDLLSPLAAIPGVSLFNLQPDMPLAGAVDISTWDIRETAARVGALDLVVTVDTMVAHLAGALGVRTWTLLGSDADWRWMQDRPDSPWYPTMRLWRQARPGDWTSVAGPVLTAASVLVRTVWSASSERPSGRESQSD